MGERADAIKLAKHILDRPEAGPDDYAAEPLALLSRQLLRSVEIIGAMHKQLQAVDWDGQAQLDLIHANRDEMLKQHEEAVRRIRRLLANPDNDIRDAVATCLKVLDALSLFQPMHDDWCGWPEGS